MNVAARECMSMRLLAREDWTVRELRMTMQVSRTETVRKHVEGGCAHDHGVSPLRDWDGWSAPTQLRADARGVAD